MPRLPSASAGGKGGVSTVDMPAVPTRCRASCSPGTVPMDEVVRCAHTVGSGATPRKGVSNEEISRGPGLAPVPAPGSLAAGANPAIAASHSSAMKTMALAWKSGKSPGHDGHDGIVQFRSRDETRAVDQNAMAKCGPGTSRNVKARALVTVPEPPTKTTIKVARLGG
jgi:hypothetical protein